MSTTTATAAERKTAIAGGIKLADAKHDITTLPRHVQTLVQRGLKAEGYYAGTTRGIAGPKTLAAYDRFFAHFTGKDDDETSARFDLEGFKRRLIEVAKGEVGVIEEGGNNRGFHIDKYERATWLDWTKDYPWCASFVAWCIQQALGDMEQPWKRPRTASAQSGFEGWALDNDSRGVQLMKPHKGDIQPGDIVVFKISHIGICVDRLDAGSIMTVEGNTSPGGGSNIDRDGDVVAEKARSVNAFRSVIRFV